MSAEQEKKPIDTSSLTFQSTVNNIGSHAIITLDADGLVTSWNKGAEKLTGWKKDEVIGHCFDFLYNKADQGSKKPLADLAAAKKQGGLQEEALRVVKSGDTYLADVSLTTITNAKNQIGYVLVAKDTTQRKKDEVEQLDANTLLRQEIDRRKTIEKALKESNEELDAFASAAGHDLQEPLRMVVSYLQLIERRYADKFDQDGLDFLSFAVDGATRMKQLINDLVEYSRIETLGKPFKKTAANNVLQKVLDSMEVSIIESKAQITHDALPEVWSDEVQLNELFQNLIANAIKFGLKSKEKPLKIHVGVTKKQKEYVFSVSDTGPGIAKKNFESIFLIFKQIGNKLQLEGSGVGLAICKKIVRRHKGEIWVESELGIGSTFYFSIPIVKEKHE